MPAVILGSPNPEVGKTGFFEWYSAMSG